MPGLAAHWSHSTLLTEIDTVFEWGYKPSEFGICSPEDDLVYMTAYLRTKRKMMSYEGYLQEQEMKKLEAKRHNK